MTTIPFARPFTTGAELAYIEDAINAGHLAGSGPYGRRCAAWIKQALGSQSAYVTTSCTAALEMAMLLSGIGQGDEVLMPSFNYVSSANAVVLRGGVPVFVDIRRDTLNLDESLLEAAITPRTKAVVAVHYAGVACEMDGLMAIASAHDLVLIEDVAHGLRGTYASRPLGSMGDLSCFSFHDTKNVTCGEGGALAVNNPRYVDRAAIVYEKGTDRADFLSGQIDRYTWQDIGSSYGLSDINAAFLWAQLEAIEEIGARRARTWEQYHAAFAALEAAGRCRRPAPPAHCTHNAHIYHLRLSDERSRDRGLRCLATHGVQAVSHYQPLHAAPAGVTYGRAVGDLAVTTATSATLVRLPIWAGMEEAEIDQVIEAVHVALQPKRAAGRDLPRQRRSP